MPGRNMKLNTLTVTTLILIGISSAHGSTLNCRKTDGDGLGWLPDRFSLSISKDRKKVQILEGRSDAFGNPDFKKSFMGSDFWSRGKGKTTSGQFRAYEIQLRLLENDTRYKLSRKAQGFYDIDVSGVCTTNGVSASTSRRTKSSSAGVSSGDARLFAKALKCMNPIEVISRAADNPDFAAIMVKALGPEALDGLIEAELIRPNALSESILRFLADHHNKPISYEDRQIIIADQSRFGSTIADCLNIADVKNSRLRAILLQGAANQAKLMARLENDRDPITYGEWNQAFSGESESEELTLIAEELFSSQDAITILGPLFDELGQSSMKGLINVYSKW